MEKSAADGMDYTQLNVWQRQSWFFYQQQEFGRKWEDWIIENTVLIFENGSKIILTSTSGKLFQFLLKCSVWV